MIVGMMIRAKLGKSNIVKDVPMKIIIPCTTPKHICEE